MNESGAIELSGLGEITVPKPDIKLYCSEDLKALARKVGEAKFDWQAVIDEFMLAFKASRIYQENRYEPRNLPGYWTEIHLQQVLRRLATDFPQMQLHPQPSSAEKIQYVLEHRHDIGNGVMIYNQPFMSNPYAEVDELILFNGRPVIWEAKFAAAKYSGGTRHTRGRTLFDSMKPERIKHLVSPISQLFDAKEIGYVIFTYSENVFNRKAIPANFRQFGGVFAGFNLDRKEFWQQAQRVAVNAGLKPIPDLAVHASKLR